MHSDAIMSKEDPPLYRYLLERIWDSERDVLLWVMLNPSTADHNRNDPTVRECIAHAKRWGYGGMRIVNLFALRSPSPAALRKADDPIGPDNNAHILRAAHRHKLIVLGWGTKGDFKDRDKAVVDMLKPLVDSRLVKLYVLGWTAMGQPSHPLGVIGPIQLMEFDYARHRQDQRRYQQSDH